ncbi:ROK family protein [Clostridium malenominatum]|uniref:ROK family protein n=1 Tax=Clostridium malenominatum TaxID=1539 RepID=A0ABN1J2F8_9CLOT
MRSVGLDIGGTNIKGVVIDNDGNILSSYERKSNYHEKDYMKNIEGIIQELLDYCGNEIEGIGIGVPGIVDNEEGKVIVCPALSWKDVYLKKHIENKFKIKTIIENDVNSWTIAEKYFGCTKNFKDFVMITIGTGIGCGIYINNSIYRGNTFESGEVGYLPLGLDAYNRQYSTEDFGYFESNASASSVGIKYKLKTGRTLGCKEIFERARKGEKVALEVVEEIYNYLGLGIGAISCIINPGKIVIGGGMANEGEEFIYQVSKNVNKLIPFSTSIELSKTGQYGGAMGSAQLVFLQS